MTLILENYRIAETDLAAGISGKIRTSPPHTCTATKNSG
jgi:hypothetical protein